jgi:hypothetical protein
VSLNWLLLLFFSPPVSFFPAFKVRLLYSFNRKANWELLKVKEEQNETLTSINGLDIGAELFAFLFA